MSIDNPVVPGEEIELGGKRLVLPPIPLVKVPDLSIMFEVVEKPFSNKSYIQAVADALYYSLRRNYPDIDPQFIVDNLDMANHNIIAEALVKVNGLAPKEDVGKKQKKAASNGDGTN